MPASSSKDWPAVAAVLVFVSGCKANVVAWDDETCADAVDRIDRATEAGAAGLVVPVEMADTGEVKDLSTLAKLAALAVAKGVAVVPELRCCDHTPGGDSAPLAAALREVSAATESGVALVAGSVS